LFPEHTCALDYALASEAMAAGTVAVSEVSEAGQVPALLADNCGELPALFLEGEEVRGGRQNRILHTSVLAAAGSQTCIPVICTQRGWWAFQATGDGDSRATALVVDGTLVHLSVSMPG
jgi:hypothetical protein